MVTLSATELALLRGFVRDVLETCEFDDTGVTADLYDSALTAGEILKMSPVSTLDVSESE